MFVSVRTRVEQFLLNREARSESLLLFLLVAAAFLVRIWGISKDHFWDEMVYLQNAQVICCGKINYSELDFRPPLISLIWAARSALAPYLCSLYRHGFSQRTRPGFPLSRRRMSVGRLTAAIAALLLAFSPFFVGIFPTVCERCHGNSLLTDSPALTLVLLSFCFYSERLPPEHTSFCLAGLALALSILMRFAHFRVLACSFCCPLPRNNAGRR